MFKQPPYSFQCPKFYEFLETHNSPKKSIVYGVSQDNYFDSLVDVENVPIAITGSP